jgi:hypothetical protein
VLHRPQNPLLQCSGCGAVPLILIAHRELRKGDGRGGVLLSKHLDLNLGNLLYEGQHCALVFLHLPGVRQLPEQLDVIQVVLAQDSLYVQIMPEVEQSAFSPANVEPGISFSPCKLLQARLFAYADAHRYRLGVNYEALPINRPRAADTHNYQRDGHMRFDGHAGTAVNYEPNSFGGPVADPAFAEPPLKISCDADRYEQKRGVDDDYVQPGNLFRLMPPDEQERLIANIVGTLEAVPKEIQVKMVEHFARADPAYSASVAKGLGL